MFSKASTSRVHVRRCERDDQTRARRKHKPLVRIVNVKPIHAAQQACHCTTSTAATASSNSSQVTTDNEQLGSPDDIGMETFKQGAVATEEEQPHASPQEQWAALREGLDSGATISTVSQVMREICDAVGHEVSKEVRFRSILCGTQFKYSGR